MSDFPKGLLKEELEEFDVEVPSWGFERGGTRFETYRTEEDPRSLEERIRAAGRANRITGKGNKVSLHFPWDGESKEDVEKLQSLLEGEGLEAGAVNANLFSTREDSPLDARLRYGSLISPFEDVREEATEHIFRCVEWMRKLESDTLILWIPDGSYSYGQISFYDMYDRISDSLERISGGNEERRKTAGGERKACLKTPWPPSAGKGERNRGEKLPEFKGGYARHVVEFDLASEKEKVRSINEDEDLNRILELFLGGRGLGVKLLYDNTKKGVSPLSRENLMVFSTGPLTGIPSPNPGRMTVTTKSPLTGTISTSNSGSKQLARSIKQLGLDAFILKDRAKKYSYLRITEDGFSLEGAEELKGSDTKETTNELRERHGEKTGTVVIGSTAEKNVKERQKEFESW